MAVDYTDTVRRFSGFADAYDLYRPNPPTAIAEILSEMAGVDIPTLVVDLGCGTGHSTRLWAGRASTVVGVDASEDMVRRARAVTDDPCIAYSVGFSAATGLESGTADVVTCSQSLHWMEPSETFAEAARLLRPGGVFAAYDCDWPPVVGSWRVEAEESAIIARARELHDRLGLAPALRQWDKAGHAVRMRESGRFRHVREVTLHSVERGNAERYVGMLLTQGVIQMVLKGGVSEDEMGITSIRRIASIELGDTERDWWFSYRMRVGIR